MPWRFAREGVEPYPGIGPGPLADRALAAGDADGRPLAGAVQDVELRLGHWSP